MQFEGVYTALVTPFTATGELDTASIAKLVRHVVEGGGEGVVPLGTTGEGYTVDLEERAEVLRVVRDAADASTGLIAGATGSSTREAVINAQLAARHGYNAVMVAPPPYALPSPGELASHFEAVADHAEVPVVLYDYPARTGVSIDWQVLDALYDVTAIIAIKEASGDFARVIEIRARYGDRYEIICGADPLIVDFALWGARSWIAGGSGFLPREHSAILALAATGEHAAARQALEELLPMLLSMDHEGYTHKVRAGLEAVGLPAGYPRGPLRRLDDDSISLFLQTLKLKV